MSNKTKILETKRIFLQVIYNQLKNTPPKDYPTANEIKVTISELMPKLAEQVEYYIGLLKKVVDVQKSIPKKVDDKVVQKKVDLEIQKKIDVINEDWRDYSKEHGEDRVKIEFSEEAFDILVEQFNREKWGQMWFGTIEEYMEFSKDIEEKKETV